MSLFKKIALAGSFAFASTGLVNAESPTRSSGYNKNGADFAPYILPNTRKSIRVDADYLTDTGQLTVGFLAQFDPQFLYFLNKQRGQNSDPVMENFLTRMLSKNEARHVSQVITNMAKQGVVDLGKFKGILEQDFYTAKGQATKALALVIVHADSTDAIHLKLFQDHLRMDYPNHFDALMKDVVQYYHASKEMVLVNQPSP